MFRVGLISDTHGLLRAEATDFLRGSDIIVHAGDICDSSVLEQLAELAPLTAVRGNNDHGPWANDLQEKELLRVGEVLVYVIHDLSEIDIDPMVAGVRVVVSGHSHRPSIQDRNEVLFVNPGSAGPRRFKLPVSVGELIVTDTSVVARTVELPATTKARR
ncbi:MAG: metallophosphoesterase family protein [Tahibacter sp.]